MARIAARQLEGSERCLVQCSQGRCLDGKLQRWSRRRSVETVSAEFHAVCLGVQRGGAGTPGTSASPAPPRPRRRRVRNTPEHGRRFSGHPEVLCGRSHGPGHKSRDRIGLPALPRQDLRPRKSHPFEISIFRAKTDACQEHYRPVTSPPGATEAQRAALLSCALDRSSFEWGERFGRAFSNRRRHTLAYHPTSIDAQGGRDRRAGVGFR